MQCFSLFSAPFSLKTATVRAASLAWSVTDAAVGNQAVWVIETPTDSAPAPSQSRQALEIVHYFGRAVHRCCLPPTMANACADQVAGDATPRVGTVHPAHMEKYIRNFSRF